MFKTLTFFRSHYELLRVSQSADASTLRKAFHILSKELHPDTTTLPVDQAARKFQEVYEAYELLSDPIKRKSYDKSLTTRNRSKTAHCDESLELEKGSIIKPKALEVRRSFSGGELFSLLLLGIALLISLLLAIGIAFTQGRELQVQPSWLLVERNPHIVIKKSNGNVTAASISNTTQSTFFNSP